MEWEACCEATRTSLDRILIMDWFRVLLEIVTFSQKDSVYLLSRLLLTFFYLKSGRFGSIVCCVVPFRAPSQQTKINTVTYIYIYIIYNTYVCLPGTKHIPSQWNFWRRCFSSQGGICDRFPEGTCETKACHLRHSTLCNQPFELGNVPSVPLHRIKIKDPQETAMFGSKICLKHWKTSFIWGKIRVF